MQAVLPEVRRDFVTQEQIAGELLAARLARSPLDPLEALELAISIGQALLLVHQRDRVYGRLCPASILVSGSRAWLIDPPASPGACCAYRSPEEVRGHPPDARSDIFSFGAVLYELLSGAPPFVSEGAVLDQLILQADPPELHADTPERSALLSVAAACLQKIPDRRRQRLQNAVIELKVAGRSARRTRQIVASRSAKPISDPPVPPAPSLPAAPVPGPPGNTPAIPTDIPAELAPPKLDLPRPRRRVLLWVALVTCALLIAAAAAVLLLREEPAPPLVPIPSATAAGAPYPGVTAISPDGRQLAFAAAGQDGRMLWLRPAGSVQATSLPGTSGASCPFWSPDGRYVAFFAGGALRKIDTQGGAPQILCASETSPGGGTWNRDGVILFAPSLNGGLFRVRDRGGAPQPVASVDESRGELGLLWPQFLPDGRHYLYYQQNESPDTSGIYVGDLGSGSSSFLFTSQTNGVYAGGHIYFIQDGTLMSRRFHSDSLLLDDAPNSVEPGIGAVLSLRLAPLSAAASGALAYQALVRPFYRLAWFDRSGDQHDFAGGPGDYGPPRISPRGDGIVAAGRDPDTGSRLFALGSDGAWSMLSPPSAGEDSPVWSPDGSHVAFSYQGDLYQRAPAPAAAPELLYHSTAAKLPLDWSRDGKYILFLQAPGSDLWIYSLEEHRAALLVRSAGADGAAISPDGKWLAYQSRRSGRSEVYVQVFEGLSPHSDLPWQVSSGGALPRWSAAGSELFYVTSSGRIMTVAIQDDGGRPRPAPPKSLFHTRPMPETWTLFDVSADGQRFLARLPVEWNSTAPLTISAPSGLR